MQSLFPTLSSLGFWNWFILALLLSILETFVPGVHFLWFGLAAFVVGLLAASIDISWPWQVIAFGVVSVLTVFWVRGFYRVGAANSDQPDLNVRANQYVGRSLIIEQAIQNGRGKVRVGDTLWTAEGPDLPAGERVTVKSARGNVLVVERAAAA
jgi:inner membrane protein